MNSARTLQPQDQIAHYTIVGPLGAGGMGEVYLAQDRSLERNVALKVLPPELVRSEDRVRRFVREAKSASSLNHPNIVTIYEIGQDDVHPVSAGTPASAVHYISMELVSGETLSTKIHQEKTDLRTLLGYLAQAAEGLAKAHAAGIVHRDLKPGNIMVSKDGFTKILDFGLAKLTERESPDNDVTVAPAEVQEATSAGAVIGTVGYMSPEQVRGSTVDSRSDIFAFGCILYEAATRKKPFIAESNVEVMHKILHDKPLPIEDLNKNAPAELRRLIRRCLAKNPEQRLQSAKDLAIELREIVDEYDTLSASGSSASGSGSGSSVLPAAIAGKRIPSAAIVAGSVLLAAVIVAGVLLLGHRKEPATQGAPSGLRISAITSRGLINGAAISPDGRYVAYSLLLGGERTLWVHQIATGSDVQILPSQVIAPTALIFSPDGNYLYYQSADPDRDGYTAIFGIPTLGGSPRKVAYDVDSRISFSPDGKQICFRRGVPHKNREDLVVRSLDQGQERVLASVTDAFGVPAWSPDGKTIAVPEVRGQVSATNVVTYRVQDGHREMIGKNSWTLAGGAIVLAWLPDGKGLVVSAFDPATFTSGQLWVLSYPDGAVRHVTSDLNTYSGATVSADGSTIAAVRLRQESNLWSASTTGHHDVRQITFGSGEDVRILNFTPGQDSTIFYSAAKDGSVQIFRIGMNGSGEQSLTSGVRVAIDPHDIPGFGILFVGGEADFIPHIWKMDETGENARVLTSGKGEFTEDVSRDGRVVLFNRDDAPDVLWSLSTSTGAIVRIGESARGSAFLSPDGTRICHTSIQNVNGQGVFLTQIVPVGGGGPVVMPAVPQRALDLHWTPDGAGLTLIRTTGDVANVYRMPLQGGSPVPVTHFTDGRLIQHLWSEDGKHIAIVRRMDLVDNLWVVNADGSNPIQVTDFETGTINNIRWTRDGSRVLFTYGAENQNVVLIRNFQ